MASCSLDTHTDSPCSAMDSFFTEIAIARRSITHVRTSTVCKIHVHQHHPSPCVRYLRVCHTLKINTSSATSTNATMNVTATTIHPAVLNGRPNIRLPVCPTVLMAPTPHRLGSAESSRQRSAKSCRPCRWRMYASTKNVPERTV